MAVIDNARLRAENEVASIGSFQSRIATAVSNLLQSRESYDAAESRIMDADTAEKTAELMKGKILEQAASAVLAQANQLPALLLSLLRG
jgi:flagellin